LAWFCGGLLWQLSQQQPTLDIADRVLTEKTSATPTTAGISDNIRQQRSVITADISDNNQSKTVSDTFLNDLIPG
jgi:hypothetical protein